MFESVVVRFRGKPKNGWDISIDEVYFTCPACEKLVYDEGLPYAEFRLYVQSPRNTLTCDDCEEKGVKVQVSRVFLWIFEAPYCSEEKRVALAKSTGGAFLLSKAAGEIEAL